MNDKKIKLFNIIVLISGIILTLIFSLYADGGLKSLLNIFTLFGIVPYLSLLFIFYRAVSYRILCTVGLLGFLLLLSTYFYIDSLFIHPDAQGALTFLFLPIYQILAIFFGFIISAIVGFIQKKR
jgi:hypothetical protein